MAKTQYELVLINITFQILSNKVPVTDPLVRYGIADGKYNVRIGALTNAQLAELRSFCVLAGIHVSNVTAIGDSYATVVVCGISIESKHQGELFVIPDRTQNPFATIKLSHIPGTDWIDLVSIKPYTTGKDEEDEMRSIIGELKEFADKTETPVVTAEQQKVSDCVTLHGVIIHNVARPHDSVVNYTFDNVSKEDLDALMKLYKEHPLINRPMERHPLTHLPHGDKYFVTIGVYIVCASYNSHLPCDTPIDITIELHQGQINPTICDATRVEDKPIEEETGKKKECAMSERTHTIELKTVLIREGVLPEGCDERHHIAIKIFSDNDDVHKRIFKMYEDCPIDTWVVETKLRYMPSWDGNATTVVIFVPDADEIDMEKIYGCYSNITLSLESSPIPGNTLINAVVKYVETISINKWDGLPKKQHDEEKCECIKETMSYVQAIDPKSDIAKKLDESIHAISANPGETIWIDSLGCNNKTKNSGGTTMRGAISIEKLFFSGSTTIVMWSDGTKTVAKPIAGDKFDPEMGIAMAFARKFFGSRHQAEKFTANAFRESYARDAKSLTEKELVSLLQDNEKVIATAKAKHDAVHQAYEKAVQEGSKKLPKLYGLKSDPDYRYASIRVSVIKAELESRKAKKAARAACAKKPTTAKKPSTRKKSTK
jgi:hypothetical protein